MTDPEVVEVTSQQVTANGLEECVNTNRDLDPCNQLLFLLSLVHLIYVRYSLTSETAPDVDMTYLQFKWTEMFFMLDVNQDNILDTADVDLSCEYFIRINNMTDEEVWQ